MTPKTVKIYGQNGEQETHTYPNARDLVNGCEGYWKWDKHKVEGSPMDPVPFATVRPPSDKSPTQEILDRIGTGTTARGQASADVPEVITPDEPEVTIPEPKKRAAPAPGGVDVKSDADDESVNIPETASARKRREAREARAANGAAAAAAANTSEGE